MPVKCVLEPAGDFFRAHIEILAVVAKLEAGQAPPNFRRFDEIVLVVRDEVGGSDQINLRLLLLIIWVGDEHLSL